MMQVYLVYFLEIRHGFIQIDCSKRQQVENKCLAIIETATNITVNYIFTLTFSLINPSLLAFLLNFLFSENWMYDLQETFELGQGSVIRLVINILMVGTETGLVMIIILGVGTEIRFVLMGLGRGTGIGFIIAELWVGTEIGLGVMELG